MRALTDRRTGTVKNEIYPCAVCGAAGVRNVAFFSYCPRHLAELYGRFNPQVFTLNGVGLQDGPLRPDYGDHYAELRCNDCDATWTGIPGDRCGWCQTKRWRMEDELEGPTEDARRAAA